jgi:hypothetical protein
MLLQSAGIYLSHFMASHPVHGKLHSSQISPAAATARANAPQS